MQFEFAGALAVADGRYLARDGAEGGRQSVLVVETLGAPPPPGRRRQRARAVEPGRGPEALPLARATAVRAFAAFEQDEEAERWLEEALAGGEVDALVAEGIGLLNRALHAQAAASADPHVHDVVAEHAVAVRIGYGSGEDVAAGRFATAYEVDVRATKTSRRGRRADELHPQERVAAVLGGREQLDACETMLLRARADLDAGRLREAALQLRVGLEALLVELPGALRDAGHESDMAELQARRSAAGEAANMALKGPLDAEREQGVRELLEICERVLRRRRVLHG